MLLLGGVLLLGIFVRQLVVGRRQQAYRAKRQKLVAKLRASGPERRHRRQRRENSDRRDELRFGDDDRRQGTDRRAEVRRWQ